MQGDVSKVWPQFSVVESVKDAGITHTHKEDSGPSYLKDSSSAKDPMLDHQNARVSYTPLKSLHASKSLCLHLASICLTKIANGTILLAIKKAHSLVNCSGLALLHAPGGPEFSCRACIDHHIKSMSVLIAALSCTKNSAMGPKLGAYVVGVLIYHVL